MLAEQSVERGPVTNADRPPGLRQIWLCADDYGIAAGVNAAIRDLVMRRRINATSVMVVAPSFHRSEAVSLALLAQQRHAAIGLHITLTAPFRPLSKGYTPLRDGAFLPLGKTILSAWGHQLKAQELRDEINSQLRMFIHTFGRAPDFVDGHLHVHLLPQVRDAVLGAVKEFAPGAWVRQCGRNGPLGKRLVSPKALLLDAWSKSFRRRAEVAGVRTNPAFSGAYQYSEKADFAALFPTFLKELPDAGLVMCHPGVVDAELRRLDALTTIREREYAFLKGEAFPAVLASQGVTLA